MVDLYPLVDGLPNMAMRKQVEAGAVWWKRVSAQVSDHLWVSCNLSLPELPTHLHDVVHRLAGPVQQRGSAADGDVRPTTAGSGVVINGVPSFGLR
jgi:hypothetical protein